MASQATKKALKPASQAMGLASQDLQVFSLLLHRLPLAVVIVVVLLL